VFEHSHALFLLSILAFLCISSVKDIAYLCGFSDPLYFSRSFKKYIGQSPKDFIKNIKNSKQ